MATPPSFEAITKHELEVLRTRWSEVDPNGFEAAGANPFKALEHLGLSYGSASNIGLGGYLHRAWVKVPGVSQPLVAASPSKLLSTLTVLVRALSRMNAN